ncbi:hypothetical protein EG328_011821 [Venturia inaequalis]|uniref:Uncharacterized protein n=1 Tax=Venturia inaequalis TaxID=5025 RepID=A0A8H3Z690_VENIN|nr:hypothetical protein EG327_006627 [Venturia inaequalis]KAE9981146.1 hypothetical protein EG328_011821 [Venturia inaequalis]
MPETVPGAGSGVQVHIRLIGSAKKSRAKSMVPTDVRRFRWAWSSQSSQLSSGSRTVMVILLDPGVLGMLSKAMATIITQPMFVAKIGLQSRPPPSRKGKPFTRIAEVISYILTNEGWRRLYKGLGPQLSRAILFQGNLIVELVLPPLLAYELEAKKK